MMDQPCLPKSKRLLAEDFKGVGDLPVAQHPISFREEDILQSATRIANEFNGRVRTKNTSIVVVTDFDPKCPHMLILEFLDEKAKKRVGYLTMLMNPPIDQLWIGNFVTGCVRAQGIAGRVTRSLKGYYPAGIEIKWRAEEFKTKRRLLYVTNELMKAGEIVNWRLDSPDRPEIAEGDFAPLPIEDQLKIERAFLESEFVKDTPLFRLLANFDSVCVGIRTCLNYDGKFVFEAFGRKQEPFYSVASSVAAA